MKHLIQKELLKYIDVNTPIIYINDFDFARVDDYISSALKGKKIIEWNPATGYTRFETKERVGSYVPLDEFLEEIYTNELITSERYIVLKEANLYFSDPKVIALIQLIAQRRLYDRTFTQTIIMVSSGSELPSAIEKYVAYLEVGYPDDIEINELIDQHVAVNNYSSFEDKDKEKLKLSLKGMSRYDIDRVLDMAMSNNGTLTADDASMILKQKKQMVKKSGLVELVDAPETLDNIGGLDSLKEYLRKKSLIIKNLSDALRFGVSMPKGVFLVGMPGCGKSLCAKAASSIFEVPLLKLDMGSMMGKYVGQSEENLRNAIKIAEAAAPCILWIDEIEKAFSGVGGKSDAVLTRMFGNFLYWMQEKRSSVYVIATANNADDLPPELKRKGRFDEIFCINLPNKSERQMIFEVHLNTLVGKDCLKNIDSIDVESLASVTDGFNGADIESVVHEAVEQSYHKGKGQITTEQLKQIAKGTLSISMSCGKQIQSMRRVFEESCFKDATTGRLTKNSK